MILTDERRDGLCRLVVSQEQLDADLAPELKRELCALMDQGQRSFLVDLTRVEFIDSTALGVLVHCLKRVRNLVPPGDLSLCGVKPKVQPLFELTRMDRMFSIHPDCGQLAGTDGESGV